VITVRFHPSGDGGPVREYLEKLRTDSGKKEAWAKLAIDLAVLAAEGLRSERITVKRVTGVKGSVWELVRPFGGMAYRIYFCVLKGEAWLVHWAEKKSGKIPAHDVGVIRRRAREVFGK
jgi:phage-related protein